ncbi:retinol dehydrogenase 12 [Hypoxylon cercidicola]|nr:retinol dehydrogenase 12 [Hypoxylon cercidicola]
MLSFLNRQLFEESALPQNVDLKKTAIVTGSNTGIGFECARQLLDLGLSRLIVAVRDESKGQVARMKLLSSHSSLPEESIEVWKLDLQSYDSITAFAVCAESLERLDIAVLNDGVSKQFFDLSPSTGHEETIQVNVLSTALLTILLLPVLKAKNPPEQPGRLVVVSSDVASWAKFKGDNSTSLLAALDKWENFSIVDRYLTSKLLCQLLVTELTKRDWGMFQVVLWERIVSVPRRLIGRPPSIGARVVTNAAVQYGPEAHGQYVENCKLQPKKPVVYTPEGERLTGAPWGETITELAFVKVEDILQKLQR